MSTSTVPTGISVESAASLIESGIGDALTSADSTAADNVQNLGLLQRAKLARLTRSATEATAQYGAKSAQATAAQAAVSASQTTIARVAVVQQKVTTPAPTVASIGWALHGRVYDAALNPLAGHTVFLVDSQKAYQSDYGFAYTDSSGYFLLNYAGPAAATQPNASATGVSPGLYVQIANTKAKPVYLSTTAFQPVAGSAAYQTVTLPAGEPALGDLPKEVRAVALPPIGQKEKL
jgi:hypothetical protein